MTEQEYREAVEILAKKLISLFEYPHTPDSRDIIRELLQQTYPCETCLDGIYEEDLFEGPTNKRCPDCKGTGQSNVTVLAVRAKNQPDFKVSIIIPAKNADENDALVTFNGKQAHFVKEVEE